MFATTVAQTTEGFVNPVAAEMVARGYDVHLVTGDRTPNAPYPHTSAILPMNRGISPSADVRSLRHWVSYLRATRPRMVVIGTPKASLLGLTAARLSGVPTRVYVIHGAVWDGASGRRRRLLEGTERATIGASTHQLAVSDSLARLISARRLASRPPDVLGSGSFSGVDVREFGPAPTINPPGPLEMCFVGRLNRDKGIDVLLDVLDLVREHADVRLRIAGGVDDTAPPPASTMTRITEHRYVTWVGEVSDVRPHIHSASLLLLPTAREGLPQVALEAQACAVPVVSWRVTGVVDAVQDGFTGLLVSYGDREALGNAARLLLTNDALRLKLSANAREWVVDRFDRQVVAPRSASYLEQCESTVFTKGFAES